MSFFKKCLCSFVFIFSFILNVANAQKTSYSDSLRLSLSTAADTAKPRILVKACFHYLLQQPDTTIILANEALQLSRTNHDTYYEMEAIAYLGMAYQYKSEYYKSSPYLFSAIAIGEKLNKTARLGSYYNAVGINFYYLKDYDKAIVYLKKAGEAKYKVNDLNGYATVTGNIAAALAAFGKNKEAMVVLRDAEKRLTAQKSKGILGNLYNVFGSVYQMGYHNLDSAEYYYGKALDMVKGNEPGFEPFQLTAYSNMGAISLLKNKLEDGEAYLLKALKLSVRLQSNVSRISNYSLLSDLYQQKGDFKKALAFKIYQLNLKDSVFKTDKEAIVAKMEAKYQSGKSKELIQEQQLQLEQAHNKTLNSIIALIIALFLLIILFIYFRFKRNVQKEVEAAKEVFFSNVVHEIRTPLSMIQGPLKVLQSKTKDEDTLAHLAMADRNVGRLNELINQMLTISKLDASKYALNESFGNLQEFLETITKSFAEQAKAKQQSFTIQVDLDSPNCLFDRDAMEKLVTNLLSNAIKYTPEKGKTGIVVSSDGKMLTISVWDNGPGIAEKDQENIFNRFFRTKEGQKSGNKGVGIGLSLVKDLVQAMGGSIDLQSKPGEGAVFTVTLPVTKPKELTVIPSAAGEIIILLVEDDKDILTFNKKLLEEKGFQVMVAENGNEASELLKIQLPDLIVTDLMMPGKTGAELLKEIRNDINTEHIPVIVLSAIGSSQTRIDTLELGAQAYLSKPFLPEELALVVTNQVTLLRKRKAEFQDQVEKEGRSTEERFAGKDPYTQKFFQLIFENLDNSEFSVELFADKMATNRSHFQRKIKALTGFSPSELIKTVRLEKAKEFLREKKGNITEVAYMSGFSSQSYFTKSFTLHFGISPSQFLQEGS